MLWPENTHLLHKGKYHYIQLTSCLTGLDSAALLMFNQQQIYLFGQIKTSQTRGQPSSDTFPYEVSECSLYKVLVSKKREGSNRAKDERSE